MKPCIHIVPFDGQWAVRPSGSPQPDSVHGTQAAAIDAGVDLGHHSDADVVVHRKNGTFLRVIHASDHPVTACCARLDPAWYLAAGVVGAAVAGLLVYRFIYDEN